MSTITWIAMLTILGLAFIQNISFSIVSRSRNRNNMKYHLIAAFFSNTIWFLTFRALIKGDMNFILFMPYCLGTMCGSLCGVRISMFIEKLLGAEADGHLKKKPIEVTTKIINIPKKSDEPTTADLVAYWRYIETPEKYGIEMTFDTWFKERTNIR